MSNESASDHFTATVWSIPDTAGGGTGNEGAVPRGVGALVEHAATVTAAVITAVSKVNALWYTVGNPRTS